MYDAIVDHAINNVWCAPLQDYEHTIMPARLTPAGGWLSYANVIWNETLPLPHYKDIRNTKRYHVYQIGKYPDFLLGIRDLPNRWINLNEIMELTDCFVNCFIDNGMTLKSSECWLRLTKPNNNILLAVQIDHTYNLGSNWIEDAVTGEFSLKPVRLDYKTLAIRFYSNARLDTPVQRNQVKSPNKQVESYTKYCTSVADVNGVLLDIVNVNRPKFGWLRVDGHVVSPEWLKANPFLAVNKTVYAYHDDTIIGKYWFKLSDLKSFRSKKDINIDKYIMFYGRELRDTIYHNDVEFFVGIKRADQFKGVYIPRFKKYTVGNIAHAIHALDTNVVADLIENNPDFLVGNEDDIWIQAVVRQGGMVRGLTYESNRIESLYHLTNDQIIDALQDLNSVMPEWRADNLENSWYMQLMNAPTKGDITPELVVKAYGYNALVKYMQPNANIGLAMPQPYIGTTVQVSEALTRLNNMADLYLPLDIVQYNKKGEILDNTRRLFPESGDVFFQPVATQLVEKAEIFVNNYKENQVFRLTDYLGNTVSHIDIDRFGFGCYVCPLVDGKPNFKWLNVNDSDFYSYVKGTATELPKIIWDVTGLESAGLVGMVRINNEVAYQTGSLADITTGDRGYSVITVENQDNGNPTMVAGQIDLWVNGQTLFRNLDYFVKWPNIYICKQILDRNAIYTVRISGLPNPITNDAWIGEEFGFVKDGVIGVGKPYQARHDKNLRINAGGQVKLQSEIRTAELMESNPLLVDGIPYACTPHVTSIEFFTGHSTLTEKKKAMELDARVNAYLDQRLTKYEAKNPLLARGERWNVVSIFFNELLTRLLNGWLETELRSGYSTADITNWVSPYQHLLELDITKSPFFNEEYVSPVAHCNEFAVAVKVEHITFLRYVNDNYLNGRVQLEKYLYVTID